MQQLERSKLPSIEILNRRYSQAKTKADQWASILEACFHFAIPFRNGFYRTNQEQGELKNKRLYDTTAVEATKPFVSRMHEAMTPPQTQWGYLEVDESLMMLDEKGKSEVNSQLAMYMKQLFKYIHASNFDVSINECYFDLAVGTSALVVNQHTDKQPLLFTSIPIDKLAIEEALDGTIKSWFRTWEDIRISEINTRWKKAVLSDEMVQSMADDANCKSPKIYEGVLYFPGADKEYVYCVWTKEHICFREPLESNPGIVWRFQKTNNDTWGRGPVMEALPSIISLQEMARVELASANLSTFKPMMAFSDGVFNPHTFELKPFAIIPIAPVGSSGQFPLTPLPDTGNPQFAQLTINDLRNQIVTLLFATSPTESEGVQPQTASEVNVKQQELAKKIGPLFSRLQHEFLEPVIQRCSYILDKMGILPRPEIDGQLIQFKYKSPLAMAKGQQEVAVLTQYIQLLQGIIGPEMTQLYINVLKTPYLIADKLQIDSEFLNPMQQVQNTMQEQADRAALEGPQEEENQ
jgi:hypothetical protein